LLGQLQCDGAVVIADFEAGIGTMMRLPDRAVDIVIVVVEPSAKSVEVGTRVAALARERGIGRLFVVGNRVTDDSDTARMLSGLGAERVLCVPEDPAVRAADRTGGGVFESAGDGVAVAAFGQLADWVAVTG
jgi:CO dehydrogenase maturation factor